MKRINSHFTTLGMLLGFLLVLVIAGCSDVSGPGDNFNTWTFSGHVINGHTGEPLKDVSISYRQENNEEAVFTTKDNGEFFINDIPFGEKTFFFKTKADTNSSGEKTRVYTQKIVIASSWSGISAPEGEVGDASRIISLFPLKGSLSGKTLIRLAGSGQTQPASNALVKLEYTGAEMENAFPRVFETTTDSSGQFQFDSLPLAGEIEQTVFDIMIDGLKYSAESSEPPPLFMDKTVEQGTIYLEPADTTNPDILKVVSNVISKDGFGKTNVLVNTTPYYVLPVEIEDGSVEASIEGYETEVSVNGDTVFVHPVKNFMYSDTVVVTLSGVDKNGMRIFYNFDGARSFYTENGIFVKSSNLWNADKSPSKNVPVNTSAWFVLSSEPELSGLTVQFTGGGDPKSTLRVSDDTLFINPVKDFDYEAEISVTIEGEDKEGKKISIELTGEQAFKTETGLFPVASNTWDPTGAPANEFELFDTMWVALSEEISSNLSAIQWFDSDADNTIYGLGADQNATVWINSDTLFVKPDSRLSLDFGETMGFKLKLLSRSGKRSDSLQFIVKLEESSYQIKWSNTKDAFGNIRDDFKMTDSVVIVANQDIKAVTAISGTEDGVSPPDLTLDNIKVMGDTIVYTPSIRLSPNTEYSMDFDIEFENGVKQKNIFQVNWTTKIGVQIISTNNREGGRFKAFDITGDTLEVIFSEPIDTGSTETPFTINMKDVHQNQISSITTWSNENRTAHIVMTDTLPMANYRSSPGYTDSSVGTRAVEEVTFDLITLSGEEVFRLSPANEKIEIHSEEGLAPIGSNVLQKHIPNAVIDVSENTVSDFAKDGKVTIAFNRALDKDKMELNGVTRYAGIEDSETGLNLPLSIGFSQGNKTLELTPVQGLKAGKTYYLWVKDLPGQDISSAPAIDQYSGTYTGKGNDNRLISSTFQVQSPNISLIEGEITTGENSVDGVLNQRVGVSAGFTYNQVVGSPNVSTESSLKFRISESAWNSKHADSINGYQVQVKQVNRAGTETDWYAYPDDVKSLHPWDLSIDGSAYYTDASLEINTTPLYNLFLQPDADGSGSFHTNQSSLFNDSSQIEIRVRPYIGTGLPGRNEVGQWSDPVALVDNVAPCDSDFVTGANCNTLARGGVSVSEAVDFDNSGGSAADETGYIDVNFPEDMDPNGSAPTLSMYYGPFGGGNPTGAITVLANPSWQTARKYRFYLSIPVFDYTHGNSGEGAYYSISVAGTKDMSGNVVQSYGSDGASAVSDHTAAGRPTRANADDVQEIGSESIKGGFTLCD